MNSTQSDMFFEAIEQGNVRIVRKMLARVPSLIRAKSHFGFTPLMRAAASIQRTPRLVKTFLDAGVDVNEKTDEGYTALHMAVDVDGSTGSGEMPKRIVKLLVDAGADLEVRQHWGWTPLMRAAVEGLPDELQALVDVGGDVNKLIPSETLPEFLGGRTTLMACIADPEMVQILINAGANLTAIDAHGQTVLEYARECIAEATEEDVTVINITLVHPNAKLADALRELEDLGIDCDIVLENTGMTDERLLEGSREDVAGEARYDSYVTKVRRSIQLIETALGNLPDAAV